MICIRSLVVTLGGRRIVDQLDLDVGAGEAVALIGSNGAGKTTVLRAALGLVQHHGSIVIDRIDAARDPIGARQRIGYMPQVPAFCEDTARGSLAFVAALRGVPVGEVDPLLVRVGLLAHARRSVRTFSTGMRQRLSLAAALIGRPPILLLDEPTASLDLAGQREFVALIRALKSAGQTLLLCSHRAEEVHAVADRAVLLDAGRVVSIGPVDEVTATVWGGRRGGLEAVAS